MFHADVAAGRRRRRRRRPSSSTGASRPASSRTSSAYRTGVVNYTGGGVPEQLRAGAGLGRLLQAVRRAGRCAAATFTRRRRPARTATKVAVLSHALWTRALRRRSATSLGKTHLAQRRSLHHRRRARTSFDFSRVRPAAARSGCRSSSIPNTTDQGHYFQAAGRLKPGVTLEQAKARLAAVGERVQAQVSRTRSAATGAFSVEPMQRRDRPQRRGTSLLVLRRRGQLRAADRLRQRRQPAARPRHRPAARDRHPRGDRRRPRPHHPPAAHRERRCCRSPAASLGLVLGMVGIRALLVGEYRRPAARRRGRRASSALDWRVLRVHARGVACAPACSSA